ncbi:hypothetical protein [Anaerospora sp.]|uniref:hypothetical protein n=1 Tax=Anaerospora sp. TaxID=1960278 RepID=UPI00289F17D6|nr:hypothetical protein [Anaerospora sp.]
MEVQNASEERTKVAETQDAKVETIRENTEANLPSAKLLFSVIQKEYEYELNRMKNLEARTGMFLAFTGALLVFVASNIKLANIYSIKTTTVLQALPYNTLIILTLLTLACLLTAIVFFIRVISLETYKRLSLDSFSDESLPMLALHSEEKVAVALVSQYRIIIENSTVINNRKADFFNKGIRFILYALIVTVVAYVLSSFMVNP